MDDGAGTVLSRVYADDASLYELIVVMTGEVALDEPRVAFFDSFRFTVDE